MELYIALKAAVWVGYKGYKTLRGPKPDEFYSYKPGDLKPKGPNAKKQQIEYEVGSLYFIVGEIIKLPAAQRWLATPGVDMNKLFQMTEKIWIKEEQRNLDRKRMWLIFKEYSKKLRQDLWLYVFVGVELSDKIISALLARLGGLAGDVDPAIGRSSPV